MCIFAIFLRRYVVKTVVKSKRRYLLNGSCDFFLVFTKRSSVGWSFWWTLWFMVEIFFGNNTSLVRCVWYPKLVDILKKNISIKIFILSHPFNNSFIPINMHLFNYYSRLPVCVSRQRSIKGQTSYAVLQNSWKDSHRSGKPSPSVTQVGQIGFNFHSCDCNLCLL